jgi:3-deoxy-D-manno-octulosonic-acid transferase
VRTRATFGEKSNDATDHSQRPPRAAALAHSKHVNTLLGGAYEGVGQLARAAAAMAPVGGGKLRASLRARRGIRERYARWGRERRDDARPLVWMHASSVGEGLQARPVLAMLRDSHPALQLAYTFFSPSAEKFARSLAVDFADYLPFDTRGDARVALDALRPRVLAFSKLDVWPALVAAAHARGVRLALVSATLAERSGRRSALAAALTRDAYAMLDAVGAIDEADAARLAALGVRAEVITITGDTRYDQVWARARSIAEREPLLAPLRADRPTVVAGSTWPADERELLSAWIALRARVPRARLIIAPHEPTEAHLAPIEQWASARGLSLARASAPAGAGDADVVLVDGVGTLGDLYALASVAYVGGGFHDAGLHSVLEPAAFGVPVLFGPQHASSRDAGLLAACGGGLPVANGAALAAQLEAWLTNSEARGAAGARARALVEKGTGASARSVALIAALLDG